MRKTHEFKLIGNCPRKCYKINLMFLALSVFALSLTARTSQIRLWPVTFLDKLRSDGIYLGLPNVFKYLHQLYVFQILTTCFLVVYSKLRKIAILNWTVRSEQSTVLNSSSKKSNKYEMIIFKLGRLFGLSLIIR